MIRMVKGTYGRMVDGHVEAMTECSGPFSLTKTREAELVEDGVAVKVEPSDQPKDYNRMKMAELRRAAAAAGVDAAKAGAAKSKKDLVALLEAIDRDRANAHKE